MIKFIKPQESFHRGLYYQQRLGLVRSFGLDVHGRHVLYICTSVDLEMKQPRALQSKEQMNKKQ
jgi:hypothetical protein